MTAYNHEKCRCSECRAACAEYRRAVRNGAPLTRRASIAPLSVEAEPEPSWESEEEEVPDYSYEPRPATWRKRARRRSGGSSRETAVRNLRELVRTREGRKVGQVAIAAAPVQLVPAPVQAPTLGPGFQEARRRGEPTGLTYPSGRVRSDGGFKAQLVCGHVARTGAAAYAAGNSVYCEICRTHQLVGYPAYAAPPKPERKRRGRRVPPSRAPAQELPSLPPMGLWQ
jgi:hypothetical protein